MIKGIGCDIVSTDRFIDKITNEKFLKRVFTDEEISYIKRCNICSMAGIWAGKEAICKALSSGFVGVNYKDIEICHYESGQPYVKLYNQAKKKFENMQVENIYISISHESDKAMAFVVME